MYCKAIRRIGCVILVSCCGSLGLAASALAVPTGEYSVFAHCPMTTAQGCIYGQTEHGEFVVGKKKVPITKTITLQGGFTENRETGEQKFVGATGAETMSKTPQNVPGGLTGLVNCHEITGFELLDILARVTCETVLEKGLTEVNATSELAASPSAIGINETNLLTEKGIALSLPVKIHLENALLGSECYIGAAKPVVIELTTGTTAPPAPNTPIKGAKGAQSTNEEGTILTLTGNRLVNNSFAAPEVEGCGGLLAPILDPIIDSQLGVPSASGNNTAILESTLKQAGTRAIKEYEEEHPE